MEKEKLIEFKNFTFKYFSQAEATLKNINLNIYKGEKVLIVGPSGSGKSTLGHCLNGLIPFSYKGDIEGSLKVDGRETKDLSIFDLSKSIGTVLQDSDSQFVGLTVAEDIAFALENDNVPTKEMKKRVEQVAKIVEMEKFLQASPYEISGGQKQRASLGGVLVDQVDILLFDEPLANLDPATGKRTIEIIDEIHQENKKTIVIIEHRIEDVLHRPVDRIILINEGQIVADMTPDEMLASQLLIDNGIREPLYLSAIRYAGIDPKEEMKPSSLDSIELSEDQWRLLRKFDDDIRNIERKHLSDEIIFDAKNIDFSYKRKKKILKEISFNIRKGEILSIIGKNGAGKSTLSKIITGFEKQDGGDLYYDGENINNLDIRERARLIGLVMQNPNQMISQNFIFDEVALGLRNRGMDEEEIEEKVGKVLEICGLKPFIKWPVSALSYGQKKRLTIASILALDSQVIILDEPTAGQDYRHYTEIMEFLLDLNKMGITIIFITHDMHLMLEYTDRALVLLDGEIIANARPAEILTDRRLVEASNLKETSLFQLSEQAGIKEGTGFVQNFINYERERKDEG